jgi:hydroxymethylglutaryl-CoA lyase
MTTSAMPDFVQIVDVAARDGLQNEKQTIATEIKCRLIDRLVAAGVTEVETTSYVSPKWVPQMADNHEVMQAINRRSGAKYEVLVPNMKGLEAALVDEPDEVVVFAAASEAFSQKNINCSISQSIERFAPVVAAAKGAGISVRGAMSCTAGCPYEGEVTPDRVAYLAGLLKEIGVDRVHVADPMGVGTPMPVQMAVEATLRHFDVSCVSGHFHDTYGQALANVLASLELGIWNFQASVAGLGGCPYAKGATGNVATEDVVFMLHGMGIRTGIDLHALVDVGAYISDQLGRQTGSRVGRALLAKRQA